MEAISPIPATPTPEKPLEWPTGRFYDWPWDARREYFEWLRRDPPCDPYGYGRLKHFVSLDHLLTELGILGMECNKST